MIGANDFGSFMFLILPGLLLLFIIGVATFLASIHSQQRHERHKNRKRAPSLG